MKRNAIIRIILWGVALVVLLAIFFGLIYVPGAGRRIQNNAPVTTPTEALIPVQETMIAAPQTSAPVDISQYNAVVLSDGLNVRTMPSTEAPVAGMVEKGTSLQITRQELVNGISWGYTPAPVNGWVVMEYVELLEPIAENKTVIDVPVQQEQDVQRHGVTLDAASIRDMEIEWAAGSIIIRPTDIQQIYIHEDTTAKNYEQMVWKVREGKVSIQFAENMKISLGAGLNWGDFSKDLIIEVPADWKCDSLEVDAAIASLEVSNLTIREMEFDGASGTCFFDNCTVEKLDVNTASGDVRFAGCLQQLDCDAASANIRLELNNVPRSMDLDTASGDLDVTLPEDAGFTVTMDALSSDFTSDFETTSRNGSYVAGNGRCRIDVDAMSGDVIIRKAS